MPAPVLGRYREEPLRAADMREDTPGCAGTHRIDVGAMNGRYDDQLINWRGSYAVRSTISAEHELHVQERSSRRRLYRWPGRASPQGSNHPVGSTVR